ncbi:MAG TPA: hypothetical protein VH082_12470 [Rudaea sp.]|jgi:pimeloyl-ACP methyl ester carboxylesterase|nr:hypothetical protein [Rudaea sp.]
MRPIIAMLLSMAFTMADARSIAPVGVLHDVAFDQYSSLSSVGELRARLFSPLTVRRLGATSSPQAQTIDLAREHFDLYVPKRTPQTGYGVLVFIPPWDNAVVPPQWIDALDRHGLIFVSAAKSGNDANVMERREPLALLAAYNVQKKYPVDTSRIYVGGFSGGSRVAERLALAYADLFRGALLNAGSDPIGTHEIPLPATDRFERFQTSSRLVYFTGKDDAHHLDMDRRSQDSMRAWCVFDLASVVVPWSGHETPGAAAFGRALDALDEHQPADPEKLAACRVRYTSELKDDIDQTRALMLKGNRAESTSRLLKIDARFGGLAAPYFDSAN